MRSVKPDDLRKSLELAWRKEGINSYELSSDLHVPVRAQVLNVKNMDRGSEISTTNFSSIFNSVGVQQPC